MPPPDLLPQPPDATGAVLEGGSGCSVARGVASSNAGTGSTLLGSLLVLLFAVGLRRRNHNS
jgi:hypothetical protein